MADPYRICSGASGLGKNYIAYLQRPTWHQSESIVTDGDLDAAHRRAEEAHLPHLRRAVDPRAGQHGRTLPGLHVPRASLHRTSARWTATSATGRGCTGSALRLDKPPKLCYDDSRRTSVVSVAVILRAVMMVLRAIDRYFDAGVFGKVNK